MFFKRSSAILLGWWMGWQLSACSFDLGDNCVRVCVCWSFVKNWFIYLSAIILASANFTQCSWKLLRLQTEKAWWYWGELYSPFRGCRQWPLWIVQIIYSCELARFLSQLVTSLWRKLAHFVPGFTWRRSDRPYPNQNLNSKGLVITSNNIYQIPL